MMTREEIIEIEQYCLEHEVSKKARLAELGIPFWNFYKARRKYQREDERNVAEVSADQFIPLPATPPGPAMQPSRRTGGKTTPGDVEAAGESYLTIELQTASGTVMRI